MYTGILLWDRSDDGLGVAFSVKEGGDRENLELVINLVVESGRDGGGRGIFSFLLGFQMYLYTSGPTGDLAL